MGWAGDSELLAVAKFADLGTLLYFQSRMFSGNQADYKSPWITEYKIFFNWIQLDFFHSSETEND